MDRCDKHRKDLIATCNWCGKKACEFCIARQEGKKAYCEKCIPLLGNIRREPRPHMVQPPPPHTGRKFVLQDGYLVIDGGR
ncbi:hypothetical protein C4580_03545 [Candidatus Woesearchaeota archaeon]|nr:MAG: hypothetical protein C4580_03545 [Candidatus Woesearchaeota archaeon]